MARIPGPRATAISEGQCEFAYRLGGGGYCARSNQKPIKDSRFCPAHTQGVDQLDQIHGCNYHHPNGQFCATRRTIDSPWCVNHETADARAQSKFPTAADLAPFRHQATFKQSLTTHLNEINVELRLSNLSPTLLANPEFQTVVINLQSTLTEVAEKF